MAGELGANRPGMFWSERLSGRLSLVEHRGDILGEPHGFGCLLLKPDGRLAADRDNAWLYTTFQEEDGRWTSWVRQFNPADFSSGPAKLVLEPVEGEGRAVIHQVIAMDNQSCLALFSTGRGIRAAVADSAQSTFRPLPDFEILPARDWELLGQEPEDCALEVNPGFLRIAENANEFSFWQNYDSYHPGRWRGDIGWLRCLFDKNAGRLTAVERLAEAPLPFRPDNWLCARCGSANAVLRIDGHHAFFYYTRSNPSELHIALALSHDPLFREVDEIGLIGRPIAPEVIVEKFQVVPENDAATFLLLYESKLANETWRTGARRYRLNS